MIYATRLLFWADGFTVNQSLILLNPDRVNDSALIDHEQTHQRQMLKLGTFTFWWRYLTDKQFRQDMEVEAYKVQISCGADRAICAEYLANHYWLGITTLQAMALLA